MEKAQENWYVVQTKPHKEDTVCHQLKGYFNIFLPKIRYFRSGNTNPSLKPLFPSYLFARADLDDNWSHRLIKFTRGVTRILGCDEKPVPISSEVIEIIKNKTKDGQTIEQGLLFKEGDHVRIKRGILKDLIGIIEKPVSAIGRIRVLLKLINHQMRANFYCSEVEKIC